MRRSFPQDLSCAVLFPGSIVRRFFPQDLSVANGRMRVYGIGPMFLLSARTAWDRFPFPLLGIVSQSSLGIVSQLLVVGVTLSEVDLNSFV